MDLLLHLDDEQAQRLVAAAEQAGQPVQSFVLALLDDALRWPARRAALLEQLVAEDGEVLRRLGQA